MTILSFRTDPQALSSATCGSPLAMASGKYWHNAIMLWCSILKRHSRDCNLTIITSHCINSVIADYGGDATTVLWPEHHPVLLLLTAPMHCQKKANSASPWKSAHPPDHSHGRSLVNHLQQGGILLSSTCSLSSLRNPCSHFPCHCDPTSMSGAQQ